MTIIKVFLFKILSVYGPECGLDDSQKNDFYDSLINIVRKLGESKIEVITGDLNGHVGSNTENYVDQPEACAYAVWNKEKERILEFCVAINMTTGNAVFKKSVSPITI